MIRYISFGLSALMFGFFAYTLFHNTLNTPSFDDYDATVSFIRKLFFDPHTVGETLSMLFSRHNEHRIFMSRTTAAVYYLFFHQLNFVHLVAIQNLFLLGSMAVLCRLLTTYDVPLHLSLLLTSSFFFGLSFYQVAFYYWGGIQYYTVFFFSICALIYLDRAKALNDGSFFLAVLLTLLSVFSFGNGFLTLFLGAFLLWAHGRYQLLAVWSVLSAVLLFVLFFNVPHIERPDPGPFRIDWAARLLFTFAGSFGFVNPNIQMGRFANIILCSVIGGGVLIYWAWLFLNGYARKKPLLYCLYSLPLLTAIIIAISRFDTKSAGGIAPRYMFFTAFIPIFLVLILWDRRVIRAKQLTAIALASAGLWVISSYFNMIDLKVMNTDITSRIDKWNQDHETSLIYYRDDTHYTSLRTWAIEHKVIRDEQ